MINTKTNFSNANTFNAIYRGIVVWNNDTKRKGRIKVFVPGVYSDKYETMPEHLPWALPMSPLFGGNAPNKDVECLNSETGWCSVPHSGNIETGSQVFVFFENGNINFPIYFGAAQSGEGWFSEHPNQHCFRSDNVRIRIDENPTDDASTTKFNSYTHFNSDISKRNLKKKCMENEWEFDDENGQIDQLETRIDIEIEALKMNAVNLNIHGNVNLHIDGDWFVEHIGDYYEYREGDEYIKHKGNRYVEREGHTFEIETGDNFRTIKGNCSDSIKGDLKTTIDGKEFKEVCNEANYIYGQNYRKIIKKSSIEQVGYDKSSSVGNALSLNVVGNCFENIGKSKISNLLGDVNISSNGNVNLTSKSGNITIKTEGEFELMKDGILTAEGFKNLGSKGNIQIVSTFGNINMQCVKNEELANFSKKTVVVPWNPNFVANVNCGNAKYDVNINESLMEGMNFTTDIYSPKKMVNFMNHLNNLEIYDGFPVILPSKMIVQNPNLATYTNVNDLSWIPTFRSDCEDWRNSSNEYMWKIPGKMMGNINIETWSGDINIKTESELGCAGNINIEAKDTVGTFPGYKIGSINIKNNAKEAVFTDPRDVFFDSDFFEKHSTQVFTLFTHGTNIVNSKLIGGTTPEESRNGIFACIDEGQINNFGKTFILSGSNYNNLYKDNAINILTHGGDLLITEDLNEQATKLISAEPPKLGNHRVITDYIMTVKELQERIYKGDMLDLIGVAGQNGFQKLDTKNGGYSNGSFHIYEGKNSEYNYGVSRACNMGFMNEDYSSINIGGFSIESNGNFSVNAGKNASFKYNSNHLDGTIEKNYYYEKTDMKYVSIDQLNWINEDLTNSYNSIPAMYISTDSNIVLNAQGDSRELETRFKNLALSPNLQFIDGGYYFKDSTTIGNKTISNIVDNRNIIDSGYDFEYRSIKLGEKGSLNTNVIERNLYIENNIKTFDNGKTDSYVKLVGDEKWFGVSGYLIDENENQTIEVSGGYICNEMHNDMFGNMNCDSSSDTYHILWDFKTYGNHIVEYFPDLIIETKHVNNNYVFDKNIINSKEVTVYSKYGNHVRGCEYPFEWTDNEKQQFYCPDESSTDTLLWENKIADGVNIKTASVNLNKDINPSKFELNKYICDRNKNISNISILSSGTNIFNMSKTYAENNNYNLNEVSGEVNTFNSDYKGAVNNYFFKMDSDHATLIKTDQSITARSCKDFELHEGNLFKIELAGSQDYCNYNLDPLSESDYIIHHVPHSNNFEITQNGFNSNKFKILNGTNTKCNNNRNESETGIWPDGKNPASYKTGDNELIITNGGCGDKESISDDGIEDFDSIINHIQIGNGYNVKSKSYNNINIDNGLGNIEGSNIITINNGNILRKGENLIEINNEGMEKAEELINSITINNDHAKNEITLSNEYGKNENNEIELLNSDISIFTDKTLNISSADKLKFNTSVLNSYIGKADFNFNDLDLKANNMKIDSNTSIETYDILTLNGNNISEYGNNITVYAPEVKIQKLNGIGNFYGHSRGSFDGYAMYEGEMYSLDWPIWGSSPTMTERNAGEITVVGINENAPTIFNPKQAVFNEAKINKLNKDSSELKAEIRLKLFKSIFKKFISLELSLLELFSIK